MNNLGLYTTLTDTDTCPEAGPELFGSRAAALAAAETLRSAGKRVDVAVAMIMDADPVSGTPHSPAPPLNPAGYCIGSFNVPSQSARIIAPQLFPDFDEAVHLARCARSLWDGTGIVNDVIAVIITDYDPSRVPDGPFRATTKEAHA